MVRGRRNFILASRGFWWPWVEVVVDGMGVYVYVGLLISVVVMIWAKAGERRVVVDDE